MTRGLPCFTPNDLDVLAQVLGLSRLAYIEISPNWCIDVRETSP